MKDHFSAHATGLIAPAEHAYAITSSDAEESPRALYVAQGGDVAARFVSATAWCWRG
jgi:hypothetical protein